MAAVAAFPASPLAHPAEARATARSRAVETLPRGTRRERERRGTSSHIRNGSRRGTQSGTGPDPHSTRGTRRRRPARQGQSVAVALREEASDRRRILRVPSRSHLVRVPWVSAPPVHESIVRVARKHSSGVVITSDAGQSNCGEPCVREVVVLHPADWADMGLSLFGDLGLAEARFT